MSLPGSVTGAPNFRIAALAAATHTTILELATVYLLLDSGLSGTQQKHKKHPYRYELFFYFGGASDISGI
jgi:hypothetical protein